MSEPEDSRSLSGATDALARDVTALVDAELARVWGRIRATVREGATGAGLLVGGAALAAGSMAGGFLLALRLLESRLSRPAAAGTVALGCGSGAAICTALALRRLRASYDLAVEAVNEVDRDVADRR